jgi:hypothetical protein
LGIEIGIRTWSALMIAMRADAMSGGYSDCHDISSLLSYGHLYGGKEELLVALLDARGATIQSSEAN